VRVVDDHDAEVEWGVPAADDADDGLAVDQLLEPGTW
jgi:hypothetical protein